MLTLNDQSFVLRLLADNARTGIGIAFSARLAINASMAGLAASNRLIVPSYVYFALGLAAVVIYALTASMLPVSIAFWTFSITSSIVNSKSTSPLAAFNTSGC